jgi:hypothetical protein
MVRSALALSFLVLVSIPAAGRADVITGVLNFTGTAEISFGSIAFTDNSFSINSPASTQQGGFTALEGTTGTIQNIVNPPDATGPLDVPDFITFAAAPNITFTLTFLSPGIDGAAGCSDSPPAAGQECSPNVPDESPFNLQNTSATSSTAAFDVLGTEVDSTTGNTIPITGIFTTQFSNLSFQDLLATVDGAPPPTGGTITTSFSAQFSTVPAPEPSTLVELLMGIGLVCLYRKKLA